MGLWYIFSELRYNPCVNYLYRVSEICSWNQKDCLLEKTTGNRHQQRENYISGWGERAWRRQVKSLIFTGWDANKRVRKYNSWCIVLEMKGRLIVTYIWGVWDCFIQTVCLLRNHHVPIEHKQLYPNRQTLKSAYVLECRLALNWQSQTPSESCFIPVLFPVYHQMHDHQSLLLNFLLNDPWSCSQIILTTCVPFKYTISVFTYNFFSLFQI